MVLDHECVRWFAWREVYDALAFGCAGGVALHYFHYDLRRFGLGAYDPCCHVLSSDRATLVAFAAELGMPEYLIKRPRPRRPHIWHYDAFGRHLQRLQELYPMPWPLSASS
jgi:hypothetical protein